jgi:hypothetical protein
LSVSQFNMFFSLSPFLTVFSPCFVNTFCLLPFPPSPFFMLTISSPIFIVYVFELVPCCVLCIWRLHTPVGILSFAFLLNCTFRVPNKYQHVFPPFPSPFLLVGMFSPYLKPRHDKQNKYH